MAVLESCAKHNMVAYLEKTDGNIDFHEIIDFLTRSFIHYALTVSPVVSTTFVEQFWMSAKSKIINNVRYITAKVAGKPVNISEASIRSDLLFDDADGMDSLHNQAIFDAIQLMGYEGDLTGKSFSGNVTPLFPSMFAQPTEDEGAVSERSSKTQPIPFPPHPRIMEVTTQAAQIKDLKSQIKQLKKKAKPVGRKSAKSTPTAHTDQVFDDVDVNDAMDYMETDAYMQKGVSLKIKLVPFKADEVY
ncbi:hypothetical protein Tco_0705193 [Tanacetum coccineum]|uniref:Uncharacterized protein n=1 Tax=Tanacetum coccineum TaxID=301880 RepID=A0ABQ4Y5C4_9ASTR